MGLDMYLKRRKKGGNNNDESSQDVGYWRKANHIHQWFVENCQDGIDECQVTVITKADLEDLLATCDAVMAMKEECLNGGKTPGELLPTQSGFFFGGTEYDEYYFDDVQDTINIIEAVLAETNFDESEITYQSSW